MARRIVTAISRALTREWTPSNVHFHPGPGRPYPCHDPRCMTRRLDAG
jgi:hypothetical protein